MIIYLLILILLSINIIMIQKEKFYCHQLNLVHSELKNGLNINNIEKMKKDILKN